MGGHHLLPSILTWHGRSWQVGQLVTPCACRSMSPKATSSPWMRSWRTQPAGWWRWAELPHDTWRPLAPVPPRNPPLTHETPAEPRLCHSADVGVPAQVQLLVQIQPLELPLQAQEGGHHLQHPDPTRQPPKLIPGRCR